jgi:hypothetical protein
MNGWRVKAVYIVCLTLDSPASYHRLKQLRNELIT